MAAEKASAKRARLLILVTALVTRLTAGALFFGSVDLINSVNNSIALAQGKTIALPYFPMIGAFLWFGGALAAWSHLPLAFCLKLAPILFDSLLAVLVFDLASNLSVRVAWWAGILYATSPVALLITSFHGQWDAIALFFLLFAFGVREGRNSSDRREFCFGALFGISLLVKPIALPFLLLFPRRKPEGARSLWPALAGLLLTLAAAFSISTACGYSPAGILIGITSNGVKGVQVFGLPFAPVLANLPLQSLRLLWIIPAMVLLGAFYYRDRLTAMDAMLLFYLFTLATAGISPQYLLWPIPFLLITARLRLAGAYTGVATLFLLLYYMNPWASYFAFENLATFAPLRGLAWLLPPAALAKRELLPWVHAFGNLVFPACTLIIAVLVLRGRRNPAFEPENQSGWPMRRTAAYLVPATLLGTIILTAKLTIQGQYLAPRLAETWKAIPAQYAMHVQSWSPAAIFIADFGQFAALNVLVLLAVLAAVWCAVALWPSLVRSP